MPEIVSLPYSDPFGTGVARPYLTVHLVGPAGASGDVPGVVDSGADNTCLPLDFASLMGYAASDLAREPMVQAGGTTSCYVARRPSRAWVVGLEEYAFEVYPTFIDGSLSALWGRADLFGVFGILFDESSQRFSLVLPE